MKKLFCRMAALCLALALLTGCAGGDAQQDIWGQGASGSDGMSETGVPDGATGDGTAAPEVPPTDTGPTVADNAEAAFAAAQREYLAALDAAGDAFRVQGDIGAFIGEGQAVLYGVGDSYARLYAGRVLWQDGDRTLWYLAAQAVTPRQQSGLLLLQDGQTVSGWYLDDAGFYAADHTQEALAARGLTAAAPVWMEEARTLVLRFSRSDMELRAGIGADGTLQSVSVGYHPDPANFERVLATSPDGVWALCAFGEAAAGEPYAVNLVLRNTETEALRWLACDTGADSDYGFFANGDVYLRMLTGLAIFTAESGYAGRAQGLPELGRLSDLYMMRLVHAIRRDPQDGSLLIICHDETPVTHVRLQADWQNAGVYYLVAKYDAQGNLRAAWTSDVPVMYTAEGYAWVDMRKNEDALMILLYDGYEVAGGFGFDLAQQRFFDWPQQED